MLICKFIDSPQKEYEVGFTMSGHVVTLTGEVPKNTSGFTLSRKGKEDDWDYSAFRTVYRVLEGAVQYSDDGSVYVEPKKNVTVAVSWNDGDNIKGIRPQKINATVNSKPIVLSEKEGWSYTIKDVPQSETFKVACEDVEGYEATINGTYITESTDYPVPEELSTDDLAEAIAELADLVVQNSSDILETQEAVAELYEMMEE